MLLSYGCVWCLGMRFGRGSMRTVVILIIIARVRAIRIALSAKNAETARSHRRQISAVCRLAPTPSAQMCRCGPIFTAQHVGCICQILTFQTVTTNGYSSSVRPPTAAGARPACGRGSVLTADVRLRLAAFQGYTAKVSESRPAMKGAHADPGRACLSPGYHDLADSFALYSPFRLALTRLQRRRILRAPTGEAGLAQGCETRRSA